MRILVPATLATLAFLSACSGGASTHESLAKEGAQLMKDFVVTLETITDKSSAEAARPKLEAIAKSMEAMKQKADALGKPTPEVEAKLKEEAKAQQAEMAARMQACMMKMMQQPEAMASIKDVMEKLGKSAGGR